ncbi:MAG: hypothetical protein BWY74_01292 [Firmicutes bacterium ADurb.Bin419]|nr:MAG: hypothetical protein BWY74_01292 [Firmicutes bacterium ADurb.Bin419]
MSIESVSTDFSSISEFIMPVKLIISSSVKNCASLLLIRLCFLIFSSLNFELITSRGRVEVFSVPTKFLRASLIAAHALLKDTSSNPVSDIFESLSKMSLLSSALNRVPVWLIKQVFSKQDSVSPIWLIAKRGPLSLL